MNLTLQDAQITDLPFIVKVYNSIIAGRQVTADLEPVTVHDWTPWFQQHDHKLRPVWLLKKEEETCGWVSFTDYKSRTAYAKTAEVSIYLEESFRGQKLGQQFLDIALETIAKRGLKNVLAVIYAQNKNSVKLFENAGFQKWGLLPQVCEVEEEWKDVIILGRRL